MTALIIDPSPVTRSSMRFILPAAGFPEPIVSASARDGFSIIATRDITLVIVELDLPDMEGRAFCRELRRRNYRGAIIMFAGQSSPAVRAEALEAGADDFVTKPACPDQFIARVTAITRRYQRQDFFALGMTLKVGDVEVSMTDLTVAIAGKEPVQLTPTEMRTLECLIRNTNITITREALVERIWGYDYFGDSNRVDVYIRRLRKKLERNPSQPKYIQTVRGIGYVFRSTQGITDLTNSVPLMTVLSETMGEHG